MGRLTQRGSAEGESLSPFDVACGLRLANPYVKRAVAGLTLFTFVGVLWMVPLEGLTALVVDDDSDIRKSIARILRLAGADVSVTGSAEDALQLLEENRWDVVVTDIGMPRLSGYDLIRQARQRGYRIPMIAVTAFDTPEHRRQIFLHGFAYYFTKPFDPDHLVAVMGETSRTSHEPTLGVRRPDSDAE